MATFGRAANSLMNTQTKYPTLFRMNVREAFAGMQSDFVCRREDSELLSPPQDTVSGLGFSPNSSGSCLIAATSWDSMVRCWQIQKSAPDSEAPLQSALGAEQNLGAPLLDLAWHDEGRAVFVASADGTVRIWDLQSNACAQVGQHEAPVRTVHFIRAPNYACLMTGSWDKTLKFWDTRSPRLMQSIHLPERCYCADVLYPLAVVATAGDSVCLYHLNNGPSMYKKIKSPLEFQSTSVSIFQGSDKTPAGFALASVGGKVAIQHVDPTQAREKDFIFKCHRSKVDTTNSQDVFPVKDVLVRRTDGILATAGADGHYCFWNKDTRRRIFESQAQESPITKCDFDPEERLFAYAVGYDWSKGSEFWNPALRTRIKLHVYTHNSHVNHSDYK